MIQSTYRHDVENIAIFKQIIIIDPMHVDQGNYKIVNSDNTLSTSGLATCTGLVITIGTKKFLTHLDAITPIERIIYAIIEEINKEKINPKLLVPIIYAGNLNSDITLQKAKNICLSVKIPETNYKILNVCMFDRVSI